IVCDYDRLLQVVEKKRDLFTAASKWQKAFNRIVIVSDSAHALGSTYKGQPAGSITDFTSFSFHAVKNFTTAEGGSATWKANPAIDDEEMYKE
ncbi:DegT/DnrJ/EryC1/StrS family aminotransferase, partial [Streptococcus oralis]|uniref:DegT/DnrJ/EryC1/StrS family aminotransferase n=1 Tax=Streptococcus oralis TaxID=1303 RepID=UPI00210C4102